MPDLRFVKLRTIVTLCLLQGVGLSAVRAAQRENAPVLTSSGFATFLVKPDGTLWGWGQNFLGLIGFGVTGAQPLPVQLGSDTDWISVSNENNHALALKQNGSLWAWGINSNGEIGNGTLNSANTPVRVIAADGETWVAFCAGYKFSIGIKADGTLWSWGNNDKGQLGYATPSSTSTPLEIFHAPSGPAENNWKSVSCGTQAVFAVAVKTDGTLWAWGENTEGTLGDGSVVNRSAPVQVGKTNATDKNWVSAKAGGYHAIGLKADGSLWAWGNNGYYQFGNGTNVPSSQPVKVPLPATAPWVKADAGTLGTLAITSDGKLYAWGSNDTGQIGDGTRNIGKTPTQVALNGVSWSQLRSGQNSSFGIGANGVLYGWGNTDQIGRGGNGLVPGSVTWNVGPGAVGAGSLHSAMIAADGTLWTFGQGAGGKLGLGNANNVNVPTQVADTSPVSSTHSWSQFAGGNYHSLALKADGTLWATGINTYGQLGRSGASTSTFIQVGTDTRWKYVRAGAEHSLALKADGTLWAWGQNNYGQLGDNTTTARSAPVAIASPVAGRQWTAVCGGTSHSAGILSDGTLWTWGRNNYGQLGVGTTATSKVPVQVILNGENNTRWFAVECGDNHVIALRSFGGLWAWGRNHAGQIGNGTFTTQLKPVQIATSTPWVQIALATAGNHSVALSGAGTAYTWGLNDHGQIGDRSSNNRNTPVPQTSLVNKSIAAGGNHTFAAGSNNVYGWGDNVYGQLGYGTNSDLFSPGWCFSF